MFILFPPMKVFIYARKSAAVPLLAVDISVSSSGANISVAGFTIHLSYNNLINEYNGYHIAGIF